MKRIIEHRKLFNVTKDTDLATLKSLYRNLMKEWHPDKFTGDDAAKAEAEIKSTQIIEAYHFLVSLSPETHETNKEHYLNTINTCGIADYEFKGQTLKLTFSDGSMYEYFGVTKAIFNKFLNSPTQMRFARRHICEGHTYRMATKTVEETA